jgi:hypothetical protein
MQRMSMPAICAFAMFLALAGCSAPPDAAIHAALTQSATQGAERPVRSADLAVAPARDEAGAVVPLGGLPAVRADVPQEGSFWFTAAPEERAVSDAALAAGNVVAAAASPPVRAASQPSGATSQPAGAEEDMTYVPWQKRQGPAYPGNFWYSFGRWGKEMPETLWDDTKATFTNPWVWAGFGAAGAAGLSLHGKADDHIADHYTRHGSQLNSFWDTVGDAGGNPGTHFAVAGAMYFTALARMDKVNYEKATTLFNALIITDVTVVGLNLATNSRSPNGDKYDWPSGHTASSFTFATVIWGEYGPWAGVPAMAFASYVGYERIDARNHDFSDVISGAILGVAIGYAVTQNHMPRILGFEVVPYVSPESGASGVAMKKTW